MIAEDITHRRALEEQLRQAQKMEVIGQLTGGIAHDFNNILTVIQANSESVNALLPDAYPELHAGLEEVLVAARRGTALVKRLLGFSRQAMLQMQPLDLAELAVGLLATLKRLIPAEIEIRFDSEDALPAIQADHGAVEQMLINLVTNARDAMPDGGVLNIMASRTSLDERHRSARGWGDPGHYVCLRVTDTGTGMDPRTREKIFEPFFTTKPQGQGTGLGMAMLYGLVKQHRGYVDVSSAPGEGTTIAVYFPLATEHATTSSDAYSRREPQGGTETVLLAEDEAPIRQAAKRVLERYGYTVLLAADGQEALELFRRHKSQVRLVISDLIMPRMGGRDLYAAVQWEAPNTPFLFTSGYSSKDRLGFAKIPLASFIQKPWSVAELLLKVREVLDR
jgi:nitrogen-specific signal transduction histidine kinase